MTLTDYFSLHPRAAVAFSGGADSAYLLWAAKQAGCEVRAYFADSAFQPAFARPYAKALSEQIGVPLTILDVDILAHAEVAENPKNRCYFCKKVMFRGLLEAARRDGYTLVLDGGNATDDAGDRPGMRALKELSVQSPLRLCGLSKFEIRRRSREAGLPTWDLPAYACLATRVPTGTPIAAEALARVDRGETLLRQAGFSDLRLRLRPYGALLQLPEAQIPLYKAREAELTRLLAPYFDRVELDEVPRTTEVMP